MLKTNTALLAATAALLLTGCGEPRVQPPHQGLRIIAMAPNTAEILYALGLSNEIVGVSRFCSYPPDVKNKPSVGGLYDPNWEILVALQPDLVIGLDTQKEIEGQLKALGIGFLGVSHEHIGDILQSILTIGQACGAETEARQLVQTLETTLRKSQKNRTDPFADDSIEKPRVLVCVGHDESLSRIYVAAKGTLYDELIELAGGINACQTTLGGYPEISPEGLATLHPDLVIDILPNSRNCSAQAWSPSRAVVMTNDYALIPGPRLILLLDDFCQAIHE